MTAEAAVHEFRVGAGESRLDQYLAGQDTGLTRSQLSRLITEGQVLVNGSPSKPANKVRPGDSVTLSVPPPRLTGVVAQDIPVSVVYQDDDLVVIDKPAGLAVHPGPGHPDTTLVNALLAMCPDIQGIGGEIRPGIVHRLDKDTSGLMVVAKTHQAHTSLSAQIKAREVTKGYLALVEGTPSSEQGKVDVPVGRHPRRRTRMAVVVGGKEARTSYKVREEFPGHSLVELYLETGRTHQIRVHMAHIGHPLVGDELYGKASPLVDRHFLHAFHLVFNHPTSGEPLEFQTALPGDLAPALEELRKG
ncbi:MAG TPA: RluA family pseudouridine synthase [Dehalococcoidia bacterium]|nr:RluA family pseudouridine synthase [Chloroflexota bacterium]HCL26309.1 RluA family pseudouridine synthase [Dehalococcoidia bacterium]|tara:strand:+ start:3573 stop:4484 length:912 start_codon:yes stop_codon:yes gene_type:complete